VVVKLLVVSVLFNVLLSVYLVELHLNPLKSEPFTVSNVPDSYDSVKNNQEDNSVEVKEYNVLNLKGNFDEKISSQHIDARKIIELANKNILTKTLLQLIKSGELKVNESLKANDSSYTPLASALFLDPSITAQDIKKFINEGAQVFNTPTWIVAASSLSPENVTVLLENNLDPLATIDGRPLTYLALVFENFETVDLLTERGYPLYDNYQFIVKGDGQHELTTNVNLYERIKELPNGKREKILKYLNME
jgi:hypothetical protein